MQLSELADASNTVAQARGRLEKIALLAGVLSRAAADELRIVVAFLSGATLQGRLGVGWSVLGRVRMKAPATVPSLTVRDVDEAFGRVVAMRGAGVTQARLGVLSELFERATDVEQDFLFRLMSGALRQGALEGVLAESVARAAGVPSTLIRQAAMMSGDLGEVACAAMHAGGDALAAYSIQLFRPVEPMLASTAETVTDALTSFGEGAFEYKIDGARIQVHKSGDQVRVFSRALRDVTAVVPEVVARVQRLPVREAILDGEVIALKAGGFPFAFQETMRRFGRRRDAEQLREALPLTPFFFDCLLIDGRALTAAPQRERFAELSAIAGDAVIPHRIISDAADAARFFDAAIAAGHEGVMAKSLTAPYEAGSRGSAWLKIKRVRTLDLVVLAAEWGSGRRRGWLSNLHLGARDEQRGGFVMLGKTFKGLTDETLEWQTAALLEREMTRDGHIVFVRPELVVEIAFNDLQESPQYPGGLALRFARVKGYRPDKSAAAADTLQTLQDMYRRDTGRDAPAVRGVDA
jgi:DNA ligase-1